MARDPVQPDDGGTKALDLDPALLEMTEPSLREDLTDEVVSFVLPDRFHDADPTNDTGGIEGGRVKTGLDTAGEGFFHGGDLKGLLPSGRDDDGDGVVDLLCQVRVRESGLAAGDTSLRLRGTTTDGVRVVGTASVTTVPARGKPGTSPR